MTLSSIPCIKTHWGEWNLENQPKSDEFFRSILKEDSYQNYLKVRTLFRFVVAVLPMVTGFLAIGGGFWAARHGGDTWASLTDLAIQLPRVEYGVSQLAPHGNEQYGKDVLGIYTLFALLSAFWFIFSMALGLWMHSQFHRTGAYQLGTFYANHKRFTVVSFVAVVVLVYHMTVGLRFFPYPENPSRYRMPPNLSVFVFESICLSALSMFVLGFVVALGYLYSRWSQPKQ